MMSQERVGETEAACPPRLSTVVHLGAGLCSELDSYSSRGARRVLLVEADPEVAEGLERRVAGLPQVEVLSVAVAARAANSVLHRYSVPGFAALHPATGLKALFPGLKEIEGQPVRTLSAEELISPLALDGREGNLLVLEAAGEELPILEALDQSGLLKGFSELRLRCGRQPLYEGAEPAERILAWLDERAFDLVAEDAAEDPDWPWWLFRRDPMQVRIQELEGLVHRLEDERPGLESTVMTLRAQLAEAQREMTTWRESAEAAARRESELQQEIKRLTEAQQQQAQQIQERDARLKQLTAEQTKLTAALAEQEAAFETLRAERDRKARHGQARTEQLQAVEAVLAKTREELLEQQRQTKHWHQATEKLKEEAESDRKGAEAQRKDAQAERQRADELERRLNEKNRRQHLLDEELIKAEAQIDLIKDILIREKAF